MRFWALDMQWFSPESAESVLASLLKGGWIGEDDGVLRPTLDISKIEIPLGWRPIARRLLRLETMPILVPSGSEIEIKAIGENAVVVEPNDEHEIESDATSKADQAADLQVDSGLRPRRLEGIDVEVLAEIESDDSSPSQENSEISGSNASAAVAISPDPWVDRIPTLLNSITISSGLERKEVMRRAQRKRLALGPVTLWMALLLVAREQRIELTDLMA